jgi:hypothetical protein
MTWNASKLLTLAAFAFALLAIIAVFAKWTGLFVESLVPDALACFFLAWLVA